MQTAVPAFAYSPPVLVAKGVIPRYSRCFMAAESYRMFPDKKEMLMPYPPGSKGGIGIQYQVKYHMRQDGWPE